MKLKRITLVVMGLAGAPAIAAAQSTVQIYGTANLDIESVEATGAASGQNFARRSRVTSNSSNIGFRGNEDLGAGLKAFYQIESAVNFNDGTSSGFWASRNSGVGLRDARSEHTSELQSRLHLVCRLLLEKKKLAAADVTRTDAAGRHNTAPSNDY